MRPLPAAKPLSGSRDRPPSRPPRRPPTRRGSPFRRNSTETGQGDRRRFIQATGHTTTIEASAPRAAFYNQGKHGPQRRPVRDISSPPMTAASPRAGRGTGRAFGRSPGSRFNLGDGRLVIIRPIPLWSTMAARVLRPRAALRRRSPFAESRRAPLRRSPRWMTDEGKLGGASIPGWRQGSSGHLENHPGTYHVVATGGRRNGGSSRRGQVSKEQKRIALGWCPPSCTRRSIRQGRSC